MLKILETHRYEGAKSDAILMRTGEVHDQSQIEKKRTKDLLT